MNGVGEKLELFEKTALSQGFSQEEVDDFLGSEETKTVLERAREPAFDYGYDSGFEPSVGDFPTGEGQGKVLASAGPVTQRFGAYNPRIERFSGGINRGTDFGVPAGTKVAAPKGDWVVAESFGGSRRKGFVGNQDNRGYGNSVVIANRRTGERLRFSHLSRVGVRPGQMVKGGQVIALSGASGNVTGSHLDIEYIDARGRLRDVLKSKYKGLIV